MTHDHFIFKASILLMFAGIITAGASGIGWRLAGEAEAGSRPVPLRPTIDEGPGSGISMPSEPPKPGYQWVLRRIAANNTIIEEEVKLERKPRYIEKWTQVGWTEKKKAVHRTVTQNEGWEYYTVEIPVYKTVPYVKYYKPVPIFRDGVFAGLNKEPVYGSKQIQTGTRTETRRRPRWVTYQEFSHWKIIREPKYGWVMEQDGWEKPELVSNLVSRTVPGTRLVWRQEPLPWKPGTAPDWLPEPDWLTEGSCPPWIPATLWELLPLVDRLAILREARGVWETAILERISSDSLLDQHLAREIFETHRLWGDFPQKMWVSTVGVLLYQGSAGQREASGDLAYWDFVYWDGRIHVTEEEGLVLYYISEEPDGGGFAGWAESRHLASFINSALSEEETDHWLEEYGIQITGNWTARNKQAVAEGVMAVGKKLSEIVGGTPREAFRSVFGEISFYWGNKRSGLSPLCRPITDGACTTSANLINFMSMAQHTSNRSEELAFALATNNVVHELGHAFASLWWLKDPESNKFVYSTDGPYEIMGSFENRDLLSNAGFHPPPDYGSLLWRQHPEDHPTKNEVFADMFLGWVFDTWADDSLGRDRDVFMSTHMEEWILQALNR